MTVRLVCVSDTHGEHGKLDVPAGDVLLHAGDISTRGTLEAVEDFDRWLGTLPHPHKVMICGNHDFAFEQQPDEAVRRITHAVYLQDSALTIGGLKIWGSPWQPWFFNWAFNLPRGPELAVKWALVPPDTDILLTHGPPLGVGDVTFRGYAVGCADLLERVHQVRPKLHVFGHIHEAAGAVAGEHTLFVNACAGPGGGRPVVVEWDGEAMWVVE